LAPDDDQSQQDLAVGLVPLLTPTLAGHFEMLKPPLISTSQRRQAGVPVVSGPIIFGFSNVQTFFWCAVQ
jgi:hypothetical protein